LATGNPLLGVRTPAKFVTPAGESLTDLALAAIPISDNGLW
jgi:hypothetical protein